MASKRPATIAEYIRAAPREGQPHLRRLYAVLKSVAPEAEEAHKAHCNFAPTAAALEAFRKELERYKTSKNYLQIPYNEPLPEDLVRKIAEYRLRNMGEGDAFW